MPKKRRTRDFGEVIQAELDADPKLAEAVAQEILHAQIAQQVYALRIEANLTQSQLAKRVGTQQSVISRIEDADYEGHSLTLLGRIADALGKHLRVDFYSPPTFCEQEGSTTGHQPKSAGVDQFSSMSITCSSRVIS
jgi:DNA-binding XRE family transcriptional regulator